MTAISILDKRLVILVTRLGSIPIMTLATCAVSSARIRTQGMLNDTSARSLSHVNRGDCSERRALITNK